MALTRLSDMVVPGVQPGTRSSPGSSLPASLWLQSPYVPRAVRRVATRYSLTNEDCADIVQELQVVLLQTDPDRPLNATWIFQTASHKAADLVRRRLRAAACEIGAPAPSPPVFERAPELLCLLRAKAAQLPPKLKAFYDLRYGQGLSQRDVARRLGACRASVRWLERQCVERIRRIGRPARLGARGEIL